MNLSRKLGLAALILMLASFLGAHYAQAQNTYASIHGTVSDTSGAVVPGAKVTVTNGSTGQTYSATTDGKGYYILPQLPIGGPYSIRIDQSGFKSFQAVGVQLTQSENYDQDAALQAGSVSQTVEVNANAVQVATSDTQMDETFGATEIEQLPMLGRDATIVQKLTPGTVESSDRFGNYSSNGSQTQENSYLVDGADINDPPLQTEGFLLNPDALGEITLLTSTQNPQYSRDSGAIINETIKSGTNSIHGDGFEFYRDTFMNLGGYFALPGDRPVFQQNLYGGTLGGPLLKNKLFGFVAYQGFHNATAGTTLAPVPDAAQLGTTTGIAALSGDSNTQNRTTNAAGLTGNAIPIQIMGPNGECGPKTSYTKWDTCFPANSAGATTVNLPTSDFNPISAKLLSQYVPAPNDGIYYNFNAPSTEKSDQGVMRLDAQVTHSDLIWSEGIFQSEPSYAALAFTAADLPGWPENNARHIKVFDTQWQHTFSPTTLNTLRAGYFRFNFAAVEPAQVVQPSTYGFDITPQDPAAASLPKIGVTGYFTLGFSNNGPQPRIDANEDYADNFTKIIGNHNMTFGVHAERFFVHNPFYADLEGDYGFTGSGTYTSGDPLLDFLVGIPTSYSQGSGAIIQAYAWEDYAYAQDNWKVSNSFTFNYGIGYDIQTPFKNEQYGGVGIICWVPGATTKVFPYNASTGTGAPEALLYPGDPGCNSSGGATAKYDHFAPRIGFDWSPESGLGWLTGPTGEHRFALRGGVGLYFNRDTEEEQLQNLEDPPFGISSAGAGDVGGSPGFANPFQDAGAAYGLGASENNRFPYAFPTPGQAVVFSPPFFLSTISSNYDVPYAYNFNLNIQRQLPGNQVLQVGYVGSLGRKLVRAYEANRVTAAGHADLVAKCQAEWAADNPGKPYNTATSYCTDTQELSVLFYPQDFTDTSGNYGGVGRVYTDGSSNYHSLQVSLNKQVTHGLYYSLGYTWSHALDDGSSFESSGFGEGNDLSGTNWVPGFQQLSYGNSQFDARNRFFGVYEYVVPLTSGMRQNYVVNEALGGWHVGGYTVLQSGNPVSVGEEEDNRDLYCDGFFNFYSCPGTPVSSSHNVQIYNPRNQVVNGINYWFNTSGFSQEPLGTFGNVTRGYLRGPGFNYTDMDLFKDFPIGHADSPRIIEIRMEAFNVFNHPNFAEPDGNLLDGPLFGSISGVVSPTADGGNGDPQPGRAVQLAGKIYF